jgi:hypothetical protein
MCPYWLAFAGVALLCIAAVQGQEPTVYQELEEATARIGRLKDKPYEKLWPSGFFQPETLIFKDLETGNEVWALTRELCTDLANIERRCAWSCNGQYIAFIGNMVFWNHTNNQLWKRTWAGYNYVALADGSARRKLWGRHEGKLRLHQDKFNNWDQKRANVLYYPDGETLWRVTLGQGEQDNVSEPIYKFPKKEGKIIQEVSDTNFLLIEESGKTPNCYVVNLNKDPKDPLFCLTYPLKGEVHPGSFRFRRSQLLVTGGYESKTIVPRDIRLLVDPEKGQFAEAPEQPEPFGVQMAHLWYGPPDDRAGFSGSVRGKGDGLFVQLPGKEPVLLAKVSDGHPTWCGHDPDWFFYAIGEPDTNSPYNRRLVAANADGKQLVKICTPFDRRRGGRQGYDAIPRPNQSPDATKCWFHSSMLMPSDEYTGSYIAVFRRPYPPVEVTGSGETEIVSVVGRQRVKRVCNVVKWKPHPLSHEVKGYHVYRSADGGKTFGEVTSEAVVGAEFRDASINVDRHYVYAVTAEEWSGLESDTATTTVPGQTIKGWDKTAPAKVAGFAVKRENGLCRLTWQAAPEKDLRYYNLYSLSQGRPEVSQKRRFVSPPRSATSYLDWTAPVGGAIQYALTAVDRQGNESEPAYAEADGGE